MPPKKTSARSPVCLITGGASLLAEGIARALISDGWRVILADIDLKTARASAKKLGAAATAAKLDVTKLESVRRFVAKVGALDGLVNGAGGQRGLGVAHKPFTESTPAEWEKIIGVNLDGVLNCIHAVLPAMMKAKRGSIVTLAASRGYRGQANAAVHSGAKGGVLVFCQNLAAEAGPYNVRINTLLPGHAPARWKKRPQSGGSRRPSPLGRATTAEDVGSMVAYLMSEKASHITGACLDVSGGTGLH
jgi:2-hydroxycyclohexanecarboxyl-CoA dehydrogenase